MMWWDRACGSGYWTAGWGVMHAIIPLTLLAFLVFGVILLVRKGRADAPIEKRSGLEILDERYARGNVDREEYLQKRKDLEVGQ